MLKLKRLGIYFVLLFLILVASMYCYLVINKPLSFGIGYDPNTNEVLLDFHNESLFPIYIDRLKVMNENDVPIKGKEFMYRINSKNIMLFSDELLSSDLKDQVEFFKPLSTLYIQANDDNISNSILIQNGEFDEINEVKVKIRILGFLPFQISRDIDLDINKDVVNQSQEMSWGLKQLLSKNPSLRNVTGKGVKIALIDSGVSEHEALSIQNSISMIDERPMDDEIGHGTQMAGTIVGESAYYRGIAPEANLLSIKIINTKSADVESLNKAIEWSMENDIDIINLSLTGEEEVKQIEESIKSATEKGIHIVAAVGDWSSNSIGSPAIFDNVIAVAAIDIEGELHGLSNFDSKEEILLSPGVAMLTPSYGNTYNYISGSSVATAFVTGVIALILEKHGDITHEQLSQNLFPLFSNTF